MSGGRRSGTMGAEFCIRWIWFLCGDMWPDSNSWRNGLSFILRQDQPKMCDNLSINRTLLMVRRQGMLLSLSQRCRNSILQTEHGYDMRGYMSQHNSGRYNYDPSVHWQHYKHLRWGLWSYYWLLWIYRSCNWSYVVYIQLPSWIFSGYVKWKTSLHQGVSLPWLVWRFQHSSSSMRADLLFWNFWRPDECWQILCHQVQ